MQDDLLVGRGHMCRRSDGRTFVSIDAWHAAVFDRLAEAISADLPGPLYTVLDEAELDLTACWQRAGFTIARREWEYLVPTDAQITGLDAAKSPPGVAILPIGAAQETPLRAVDRTIRDEVAASVGWQSMPAEVLPLPEQQRAGVVDPSKYAVAAQCDQYVGLLRLATMTRQPRIGLIAVVADQHRRGIARALLAQVLGALHRAGTQTATAQVDESNAAALALFEGVGARRAGSNLELVRA
ncbi:MAG TPA: GNAT family N-acetyltransferase [Actinocrinis sp.]